MYPNNLTKDIVDSLYARCDQLERTWSNVPLALDFSGRMVDAVLRYLAKVESTASRQGRVTPRYAVTILDAFWRRNAGRDAKRLRGGPERTDFDETLSPAYVDPTRSQSEIVNACRQTLIANGERPEVVDAFLLESLEVDREEIRSVVEERSGRQISSATLRQWAVRHYPRFRGLLSSSASEILGEDELSPGRCHGQASATAFSLQRR